ncbi:MAG TPA: Zn-dependent hydrolase [Thermoanaerobaculia bacterium]|jgi:hypothetical protein
MQERPRTFAALAAALLMTLSSSSAFAAPPAPDSDAVKKIVAETPADLPERLARWKPVDMPFDAKGLSPRERQLVEKLVAACRDLENLFWRQSDPESIAVYRALAGAADPRARALRRLLWINGERWDLLDAHRPLYGRTPMPPGRSLYPADLTRDEVEAYVARHPGERKAIYSPWTVLRRRGERLEAVPYHVAYRPWIDPASRKLAEAAALSDDPGFAKYLRLLSTALTTDDYYEADSAWVDLDAPRIDLVFAPYETYLDDLLGVKTSYGAAVMVRNETESRKLDLFRKYVAQIQDALPLPPEDRPSLAGKAAPMEVMDTPFRAGDLRHGYQAVADNLPNDPRIHEEKGSKRLFFKNYMDARVNEVVLPVARRVMVPEQARLASADGYLTDVLMHEICHGLGPAFARTAAGRVSIRESVGAIFSAVEEAKADMTGMYALDWLVAHGVFPKERLDEFQASYVAGIFRTVRFGTAEAHARGEMMQFNFLSEKGAIRRTDTGLYTIDASKWREGVAALAKELLEIEATGDRARAEAWFARYDKMPEHLRATLERAKDLPVDVDPKMAFPEGVE